jgi:hypothetical protein
MGDRATGSPSSFVGGRRAGSGHPWRPVVQGATEAEAWDRLLDAAEGGDKAVLAEGNRPDDGCRPRF